MRTIVFFEGSNGTTVVFSINVFFAWMNASSCSSSQRKAVPFLRSGLILAVRWAKSGMNAPSCSASPRKDRSSLMFLGVWNFEMALYLLLSGEMPFLEMMCPANSISSLISNFFLEMVIFRRLQFSSTCLILLSSCCLSSAQMIVSSTIFLAERQPSIMASDFAHHSSEEVFRPMGALVYLNLPWGWRKVVRCEDSSSRASWEVAVHGVELCKDLVICGDCL